MKLIVGLGNPGIKYEKTRHNVGFVVVEQFLKDYEPVGKTVWEDNKECKSDMVQLDWQPKKGTLEKVILAKPKTYMNNSGMAVMCIASYYKVAPEDIWVVHDEIDLPLGSMKIRFGGASAGHHGVESIMEKLGTDKFWRFRMGTGRSNSEFRIQNSELKKQRKMRHMEDYVLSNFIGKEKSTLKHLIKRGSHALRTALEKGMLASQNQFNTK